MQCGLVGVDFGPIHSSCCLFIFAGIYRVCMLFRHVGVEWLKSFIKISFDYYFVWKLILGTSMVEERSLVKHRLKRLLDQSDLDTLVLCEDWLRKRLAASREPCGFNRNPTGSKDRCAVCRVCGWAPPRQQHS